MTNLDLSLVLWTVRKPPHHCPYSLWWGKLTRSSLTSVDITREKVSHATRHDRFVTMLPGMTAFH
jgi:hypothetical protein